MLAIMTNLAVFYLATLFFERAGICCAVTVFLTTALAGTIIASIIEEYLTSLLPRGLNRHGNNGAGRAAVTTPLS